MHQNILTKISIPDNKIKEDFENNLYDAINWREIELANLKLQIQATKSHMEKSFLLRGGWALLYAHWEGAIKDILCIYRNFINDLLGDNKLLFNKDSSFVLYLLLFKHYEQSIYKNIICNIKTLNKLLKDKVVDFNIYKNVLFEELKLLSECQNIKADAKNELQNIRNLIELKNYTQLKIAKNVINTESNLGFDVLRKLFNRFDIRIDPSMAIEAQRINQILKYRNDIAHGDKHHLFESAEEQQLIKQLEYLQECIDRIIFIIKKTVEQLKLKKEELC